MNLERNRIEDILSMGDQVQRVSPSNDLLNCLKSIPEQVKQGYDKVPKKVIWMTAASIALLISLNFLSLNEYKQSQSNGGTTESADDSYFSYMKNV